MYIPYSCVEPLGILAQHPAVLEEFPRPIRVPDTELDCQHDHDMSRGVYCWQAPRVHSRSVSHEDIVALTKPDNALTTQNLRPPGHQEAAVDAIFLGEKLI